MAQGRVYQASNATVNTALAVGGTSFVATTPAFLIDIPTGYTLVPLSVKLDQGGTVAGAVITLIIAWDNIARWSSGGTAMTVRNMLKGGTRTSSAAAYTGATAAAASLAPIAMLEERIIAQDVATNPESFGKNVRWPAAGEPVPWLVGPASFLIYTFAGTTQPSWFWSIKWAELDSGVFTA